MGSVIFSVQIAENWKRVIGMSDNFANAMKMIIDHEGGYTDDPHDYGGKTIWGITQNEIQSFLNLNREPAEDEVKNFPLESATKIYLEKYWLGMNIDAIKDPTVQLLVFDQHVNRGKGGVFKLIAAATNYSSTQL